MNRPALALAAALALLAPHGIARAQAAYVVSDCTAVSGMPLGPNQPLVEDQTGKLCGLAGGSAPTTPSYIAPSTVVPTDKGGTITTGGTAQTAIAANASRKGWCIQNPSDAGEVMYVRVGATATTTSGMQLAAGQQACNPASIVDQGLVSVIAATTSHRWYGTEWQ